MTSSVRRIVRTILIAAAALVVSATFAAPARADIPNPTPTLNTDCFGNVLVSPRVIYASSQLSNGQGGYDVHGTDGDDVIIGSPGPDYIEGWGGNDIICGGDGDDHIWGGYRLGGDFTGTDYDHLDGENGDDTISGGPDTDVIYGGHGDDVVTGDDGDDIIHGQGGSDALFGNDGADYIRCGSDGDNHQNPYYTTGVGDFADGGIETNPARPDVPLGSDADCETFLYIP